MIISDIDDILFPKLGRTYVQEFTQLSTQYPFAAGFTYNRYNTELITSKCSWHHCCGLHTMRRCTSGRNPNDFSLAALINSARIANEWEDGKYVVIPSRVHTVWLHWPGIMEPGYKMHTIPEEVNIMVHMRNWSMVSAPCASRL